MKHLVGKKISKKVDFMGDKVEIKKLTVNEVLKIQEATKNTSEEDQINTLRVILRSAVVGADELSDEDIATFPLEELTSLSAEIVKYSGMAGAEAPAEEAGN